MTKTLRTANFAYILLFIITVYVTCICCMQYSSSRPTNDLALSSRQIIGDARSDHPANFQTAPEPPLTTLTEMELTLGQATIASIDAEAMYPLIKYQLVRDVIEFYSWQLKQRRIRDGANLSCIHQIWHEQHSHCFLQPILLIKWRFIGRKKRPYHCRV